MTRDLSPRMRCRTCGMPRLDDAPACAACDADLTRQGALEAADGGAGRRSTGGPGATQARRAEARPVPAPAPRQGRSWLAMDEPARRSMVRLGIEVLLLFVVIMAVALNTVGRSRPAVTASPSPPGVGIAASGTGLGIRAADITNVFQLPHAGGFVFQPVGSGSDARLEGQSAEGAATIGLYGPGTDLTRVVLALRVGPGGDDEAARRLATLFLALYAPSALDRLLAGLRDGLAGGGDVATVASANGIEARLETHIASGAGATLTLVPVADTAPPVAGSSAPSVAPTPAAGRTPGPT